jgi:hypothetical protein
MRHSPSLSIILLISIVSLAGCELAGDIFKAGVWVGAILVIGIIGLVIWMFSKAGSCGAKRRT